MSAGSHYQKAPGGTPRPEIRLPFPVKYLEPILNGLLDRFDQTEERLIRMESTLTRLEAAIKLLAGEPELQN